MTIENQEKEKGKSMNGLKDRTNYYFFQVEFFNAYIC